MILVLFVQVYIFYVDYFSLQKQSQSTERFVKTTFTFFVLIWHMGHSLQVLTNWHVGTNKTYWAVWATSVLFWYPADVCSSPISLQLIHTSCLFLSTQLLHSNLNGNTGHIIIL